MRQYMVYLFSVKLAVPISLLRLIDFCLQFEDFTYLVFYFLFM